MEAELIINFDHIDDVPTDEKERALVNVSLTALIENAWLNRLPEREKKAIDDDPNNLPASVFDTLDDVIFLQVRSLGARIFLCDSVLRRLMTWDSLSNGPHLWKRFGEEMRTHIQVWRGQKKLPLEQGMRPLRDDLKREYVVLRRWLRSQNPKRRTIPIDELLASAHGYVSANRNSFRRLRMNWHLLEARIREYPEWLTDANLTAAAFADDFLAEHTNRSIESLRQSISRMRPRKL